MGLLKRLILIGLVGFVAIQVVRPARTNPASDPNKALTKRLVVPADVKATLDRSCRNCHSNDTVWPWYSNVAPISWNVISHVNDGRGSMNFSDWPAGPEEAGELAGAGSPATFFVGARALTRGRGPPSGAFGCYSPRWARGGASRGAAGVGGRALTRGRGPPFGRAGCYLSTRSRAST